MRNPLSMLATLLLATLLAVTTGCGQKGPLTLPDDPDSNEEPAFGDEPRRGPVQ